ncbi:MAG: hypothetical protein ACFCVH_14985, partial [Alphaproteobacteria bacterium]
MLLGGEGIDTVSYAGSDAGVTINLGKVTAACFSEGIGGHADGDVLNGFENVYGSVYDDTLTGDDGDNVLWGNGGNDVLTGGAGDDTLCGGSGWDTFVMTKGGGHDTITDFQTLFGAKDVIDFSDFGIGYADLVIQNQAGGTLITTPTGESVFLEGVNAANLNPADDFIF